MKLGCVLFDGAEQLFRKWEEPIHTAVKRKIYPYHILILILLKEAAPRLILTAPRLPFEIPADKASIEKVICVAFNFSFLHFVRNPYLGRINRLLMRNTTGLEFSQEDVKDVSEAIEMLTNSFSPENIGSVIHLLNLLSLSKPEQLTVDASVYSDPFAAREIKNQERTEMIVRYIHDNHRRNLPLGEVANYIGLSRDHLSVVCRDCLPGGFAGYLLKVRLDEVVRQLIHTDYSILAIAEDCGFNTFSNFMVQFKKRYRMTPASYRKRYTGK